MREQKNLNGSVESAFPSWTIESVLGGLIYGKITDLKQLARRSSPSARLREGELLNIRNCRRGKH